MKHSASPATFSSMTSARSSSGSKGLYRSAFPVSIQLRASPSATTSEPGSARFSARLGAHVPAHALLGQLPLIVAKKLGALGPEFTEICPGIDAGIMAIVEADADRIVARRLDGDDRDIALAGHCQL